MKETVILVVSGALLLIGLIFASMSAVIVDQTQRGILIRLGELQETLEPGLHFVNPFTETVQKIDVTVQALEVSELSYSRDTQIVQVSATINYQINSSEVSKVYQDVRTEAESRYVIPRAREAIKNAFSKYTAQGIIDNRAQLTSEIRQSLYDSLSPLGITVQDISLTNLDFDDLYEAAVQNKQVQEQQALAQANITKQEEEKKKQEILKAEALAERTRLEAEALASQNGTAVIEKIYAEAQLEAARRWNGELPVHMYGSAPLPLLDIKQ